jgi:hypothetical protein
MADGGWQMADGGWRMRLRLRLRRVTGRKWQGKLLRWNCLQLLLFCLRHPAQTFA